MRSCSDRVLCLFRSRTMTPTFRFLRSDPYATDAALLHELQAVSIDAIDAIDATGPAIDNSQTRRSRVVLHLWKPSPRNRRRIVASARAITNACTELRGREIARTRCRLMGEPPEPWRGEQLAALEITRVPELRIASTNQRRRLERGLRGSNRGCLVMIGAIGIDREALSRARVGARHIRGDDRRDRHRREM